MNIFLFAVDFNGFGTFVYVVETNFYPAAFARKLFRRNGNAVQAEGNADRNGEFTVGCALTIDIIALCIPHAQSRFVHGIGFIALNVFDAAES